MPAPLVAVGLGALGGAGATLGIAGLINNKEPRRAEKSAEQDTIKQLDDYEANGGKLNTAEYAQSDLPQAQNADPQPAFKATNIGWLDDKLKKGTATAYDAYIARNYLGMNLGDYGHQAVDVNLNGKLAMTNLNRLYEQANNVMASADLYDAVLASGEGNLGRTAELARDLFEVAPWLPNAVLPDETNHQYRIHQDESAFRAAIDAANGGKPNRYTQEVMMQRYKHNSRSTSAQANLMAALLTQNNIALQKNMEQIAQLRGWDNVPQAYKDRYTLNAKMVNDLSKKGFDDKDYSEFVKKYGLNADKSYARYSNALHEIEQRKQNTQAAKDDYTSPVERE